MTSRRAAFARRIRDYLGGEAATPILVLFALNAVDELDSRTFDLLGPEIADHFNVGVGTIGAITLGTLLLAPIISVPIAYLADRRRRMPIAIAGAATWGAFSLATGMAPLLAVLIVTRVGSNFGKVVNEPVHAGLISDFYSPRARAKAFGLHGLANYVGLATGVVLAGALGQLFGWRVPFFVLTVPTVVAILFARRLAEPERGRFEVVETPLAPPFRDTVRRLWTLRSLRYQWAGLAFSGGPLLGLGVLVPFYLRDEFGVAPALRGVIIGIGSVISAVALIAGTAQVQERLNRRPSDGLRLICWAGVFIAGTLVLTACAPWLVVAVPLIWATTAAVAFLTPGLFAITAVVAPPEMRSSAFAIGGFVALSGAVFAVFAFAVGDLIGVRVAIAAVAPIFFRGVLLFFKAAKYVDDDVARLDPTRRARGRASTELDAPGRVLLETTDLTVSYGAVQVLFGVDLEVREGEILALLGTNGAGKSTTLNAISGIVAPDGGNVWFEGEAITGEPPERTVARGIVQVPGGRGVFPRLTVADNLKMGSFLLRKDRRLLHERLDEMLELFPRLGERMAQPAGTLSGGERQMLTLAQSFMLHPRLVLIDELSLGLAPTVVTELLDAVRRFNATGTTVVLVEQSVNVALTLAQRAYFLEKGEVRFSGPAAELLGRRDLLRSVFLEGAGPARARAERERDRKGAVARSRR
jgi:ABC-type branched-subunit amino acid transport system ATPase component